MLPILQKFGSQNIVCVMFLSTLQKVAHFFVLWDMFCAKVENVTPPPPFRTKPLSLAYDILESTNNGVGDGEFSNH